MQKHKELYVALAILVLSITALGIVRADFEGPDNTPPTGDGAVITDGNGNIGIANTQDFRFNGIADANWRIGRNIDAFTESLVTGNAIEIAAHSSANEGFAIGANGGSSYYEILGSGPTHYFRGSVGIGDTSPATALEVNGTITATSLTSWTMNGSFTNADGGVVDMSDCDSFDIDQNGYGCNQKVFGKPALIYDRYDPCGERDILLSETVISRIPFTIVTFMVMAHRFNKRFDHRVIRNAA